MAQQYLLTFEATKVSEFWFFVQIFALNFTYFFDNYHRLYFNMHLYYVCGKLKECIKGMYKRLYKA